MATSFDALSEQAMILPREQRLALAQRLLDSVEPQPEPDSDEEWEAEIKRRIESLDSGEVVTVPASEVFARLHARAPKP